MSLLQKFRLGEYRMFATFIILVINFECSFVEAASIADQRTQNNEACEDVCTNIVCRAEAETILETIDESVDPCDNFYKFACGGFIKSKSITEGMVAVTSFSEAQTELSSDIYTDIISPISSSDLKTFRKMKTHYKNCMDKSRIESEGVTPLFQIWDKMGGWPVLMGDNWNETNYDWKEAVHKIYDIGFDIFFPNIMSMDIDLKNSSKYIIKIQETITTISPIFFMEGSDNNLRKAYFDFMINIAELLGADNSFRLKIDMKRVLDFEIELFNTKTPAEKLVNVTESDNQITVKELSLKHPSIPWLDLLNKVFNPSDIFINENETVAIADPDHLYKLEALLKRTPPRVIANYLAWSITHMTLTYMPERLRKVALNFKSIVEGTEKSMNRESLCFNEIMEGFPIGMSAMYVRNRFNDDIRDRVAEIVDNVKEQIQKQIKEVDWMDEDTRAAALEKLEAMGIAIGYADELMDDKKIDDYYAKLEISRGHYLRSVLNITSFITKQNRKLLGKLVNKDFWTLKPNVALVNAYYLVQKNVIEIPAGFLHSFFWSERPNYLNFGAIGSIIGHEITHGFDHQGRKHDKEGNQKNWWLPSTEQKFMQKARCIIDQYNNFTIPEVNLKINGARTQGENIADNGGSKAAYLAYQKWLKNYNTSEPCLPDLNYTQNQLFWISSASIWCSKQRTQFLRDIVASDVHSPESARVVIPLSNIDEFAKDFKCPLGSRMNPVHKCVVW